jgi:alanine dehydrogenase
MPAKPPNFLDKDYAEQGAQIVFDTKKVYEADIIIKIAPPTLEEIAMMKPGQILISALQVSTLKSECLHALLKKKLQPCALSICEMKATH